jgi:GxxExxY protein
VLRVSSPLNPDQETIVTEVIECAFTVHRALGPGFREKIYVSAFRLELDSRGLRFESEKPIVVHYKDWEIPGQKVDLIVENLVLVELKTVPRLRAIHRSQVISYLKTTGLRIGILVNFNTGILKHGLRRVVV